MKSPEFIIYAYPWDEEVGGFMVLQELCARLNELGFRAAIWPAGKPAGAPRDWQSLRTLLGYVVRGRFIRRFDAGPFEPSLASSRDLKRAVVIYPEIVAGNPLAASKVVRWLLYPPGRRSETVEIAPGDLVVAYNEAFRDTSRPAEKQPILTVTYQVPAYRQRNFGERHGSCVIVRKGADRPLDQHPPDAIPVDHVNHARRAEIFNQVRYCYCYDLYTYYSIYAALCGCVPIIVPMPGVPEEEWQPSEANRLGIAYGEGRIAWAQATQDKLRHRIRERRETEDSTVRAFVDRTRAKQDW